MGKRGDRKAQVTIYIIIAILIVAAIFLVLLLTKFRGLDIILSKPSMPVPSEYIEKCARDSSEEAIKIMLPQGGYLQPKNYRLYDKNKIAYLCYYHNYYYPCINQEPAYFEHVEQEIISYITPKIKDCFFSMEQSYIKAGYEVDKSDDLKVDVTLKPRKVEIKVDKKFEVSKLEDLRKFEKIETSFNSPLYSLARTAIWIINSEAKFCGFDVSGYSLLPLYYSLSVSRIALGDGVKIYTIEDRASGKKLNLAIRSCVMPPGR